MAGQLDALVAVVGGIVLGVLGWLSNRLVSQIDKDVQKLAEHTHDHCEEIAALDKRIALLEARTPGHR